MSTIPLYTYRYIGLRNSCWAEISVFFMAIHTAFILHTITNIPMLCMVRNLRILAVFVFFLVDVHLLPKYQTITNCIILIYINDIVYQYLINTGKTSKRA